MNGVVITAGLAALIAAVGGQAAIAQSPQTDATAPAYTTDEPKEDVETSDAGRNQEGTERDDVRRVIDRFSKSPDHFTQTDGQALYETSCQACHMEDGKGAEGAGHYPPLAGNPKLVSKYFIVTVLLTGYHGMPRFGDQMDDDQIAEISNYVRENFGNSFPGEITSEDVQNLRHENTE
ncbi:c-type cytochrome [Marivita sp. S2033]|uniref:c-type cytochrome n=1 Tax=Marivita sp. S2033 TaxID=3373187 RepID=UPI003981F592